MPQVKKKSFVQKNGLIAVWTMAGFMAMGYIGFLATGTDDQNSTGTQLAHNSASSIGAATTPVQREIAALRAHVKELTSREQKTSRKLSLIEEALGPNTAALPEDDLAVKNDQVLRDTAPLSAMAPSKGNVSVNVLPLTAEDKITELTDAEPSQSYGIDLASARSIDSLKRHWEYLKKSNSALISGLKPHFIDKSTSDLPLFSLVVGPFDRLSDARGRCEKFSNASIECQETQFHNGSMDKIHTADKSISR